MKPAQSSGRPVVDQSAVYVNADRLLTAEEVAELLQVPSTWVYAEARASRIPHVRIGRYRRFRRGEVLAWVDEQSVQSTHSTRYRRYAPGSGPGGNGVRAEA